MCFIEDQISDKPNNVILKIKVRSWSWRSNQYHFEDCFIFSTQRKEGVIMGV